MQNRFITAYAHSNIALIKYWGKFDSQANLPATGSLSLTLDCYGTKTTVSPIKDSEDTFSLDGEQQEGLALTRVQRFLDVLRFVAKSEQRFCVESINNFPTASGLASSASGFAALSVAAAKSLGLVLSSEQLSSIARRGSGSAARSIFGGFSWMPAASSLKDDVHASPIKADIESETRLIIIQCSKNKKEISSTAGMNLTAGTSPFYDAWVSTHLADLTRAISAIRQNDFPTLGELTEHSTLKMHATMMAAQPGFWYLEPLTLQLMARVRKLRQDGASCYFTMDAGPHVKVLCKAKEAHTLADIFRNEAGTISVDIAGPGPCAHIVEEPL